MRLIRLAALFALLATLPAAARPMTAEESAVVEGRVAAFDSAIRANDYPAVVAFVPPKIFETVASENGVEVGTLREVVAQQMKSIFAGATLETFAIDVARAEPRELPDGTPYLLLPTRSIVKVEPATRVEFETRTLAMNDAGTWYLVRLDDPTQIDILRKAYPAFANETFPLGASRQLPAN